MNPDEIIQRTIPPDLRAAMSIVQSAIRDGDPYLYDPRDQTRHLQRITSLIWLSITLMAIPVGRIT